MRSLGFVAWGLGIGALLAAGVPASGAGLHGAADAGPAVPGETVSFTVYLPSRDPHGLEALIAAQQDSRSPEYHRWLSEADLEARFGPDPAAAARVATLLREAGFAVAPHPQGVRASGRADAADRLFGAELHHAAGRHGGDRIVARDGLHFPPALAAEGARVVDFDPFVRMHALARPSARPANRTSDIGPYWADDLRQAYHAVSAQVATGAGRTIAILMDADVLDSDMAAYFGGKQEATSSPSLTRVAIDGGAGFDASGDSLESTLDVQQSFGIAPGAGIILYVLHDLSDSTIMDGLNQVIADDAADIVSMSFSACEALYTAAYNDGTDETATLGQYDTIFAQGTAKGITFVAASGDDGALPCPPPGYFNGVKGSYSFGPGAGTPATDPLVTGVGGTNLRTSTGSTASTYVKENAHDDPLLPWDPYGMGTNVSGGVWGSGGGPSLYFTKPSWQKLVHTRTTMRATPDLALHMGGCPTGTVSNCLDLVRSGDWEYIDGAYQAVIGTSAAAPDFAGVLAIMEQYQGGTRLGAVNQLIYQLALEKQGGQSPAFHQNIAGYNGVYTTYADASAPYNMVIGNGTVRIRRFIGAAGEPLAGVPGTSSNP